MNKEVVRFRDANPNGVYSNELVVDIKFRFPLSKKQARLIKKTANEFEYDSRHEALSEYASAVMYECMKHPLFKNDGQRWSFVDNEIVLEIEK